MGPVIKTLLSVLDNFSIIFFTFTIDALLPIKSNVLLSHISFVFESNKYSTPSYSSILSIMNICTFNKSINISEVISYFWNEILQIEPTT